MSIMKPIPLDLMTLYAGLLQEDWGSEAGELPGSIATKTVKGRKYIYHTSKDGGTRDERYLGPADDPDVQGRVERIRVLAHRARQRRTTVTALKNSRLPAPTIAQGRILEVLSNAGLFRRGMALVGTIAYQVYPFLIGHFLPTSAFATNDIDLSVAEFVAGDHGEDIESILRRSDPTFAPVWHQSDTLPRRFRSKDFEVDILTKYSRGRTSPIPIASLGCAAEALSFQEYLAEQTVAAVSLYGTGIMVRVPTPMRFALHKLLVAQRRPTSMFAKKQKDLQQAKELIDVFLETDEAGLQDALDGARDRGRTWKTAINASLTELGKVARDGHPPLPVPR